MSKEFDPNQTLLEECQALIKDANEKRDEFQASRDRYANIAGQLAEYIRAEHGRPVTYPHEAMHQMDVAHGLIGYEWPDR